MNPMLSDCSLSNLCTYLINGGDSNIQNNASGCNSTQEVIGGCELCPAAPIVLLTQADVDDFSTNYPNCNNFPTSLRIGTNATNAFNQNITNLNGLAQLTSIAGDFEIHNNDNLSNLSGLQNLQSVEQSMYIEQNDGLNNLSLSLIHI